MVTLVGSRQVWGGIGENARYNDTLVLKSEEENPFWERLEPEVRF